MLAIRNPDPTGSTTDSLIANPGGGVRLAPGQLLVVMGSQEQLQRFGTLLGNGLSSVESMPA